MHLLLKNQTTRSWQTYIQNEAGRRIDGRSPQEFSSWTKSVRREVDWAKDAAYSSSNWLIVVDDEYYGVRFRAIHRR
jgi:hypothetical protein